MRRRPSPDHQEAVSRRLALLSAELAAVREPEPEEVHDGPDGEGDEEWDEADWTAPHTRIAVRRQPTLYAVPDVAPQPVPPPPQTAPVVPRGLDAVPVPGRHAARRPRQLAEAVLPDTLRGRVAIGASQVAVLAVLVALGLGVTCWWVVRGRPHEVVAPVVASPAAALASLTAAPDPARATDPAGPAAAAPSADVSPATVTVDVAGRVRRPGIAVLGTGARVVDALRKAGGARRGVDLSGLNLARVLVDGEQILVGVPGSPGLPAGAAPAAVPSPGTPGAPLVDLNTATEPELEALPEVGPVTAQSILTWRDQHGGFSSVDELLEVDGIGEATLGKLAPLVTV